MKQIHYYQQQKITILLLKLPSILVELCMAVFEACV